MILIAPLAFVAWVIPGTEKFFKQWWTDFIRLNAMFVTIMALLSGSIVISSALTAQPDTNLGFLPAVMPIVALFLIPKTLKATTKGLSALSGAALGAAGAATGKATSKAKEAGKTQIQEQRGAAAAAAFGKNTSFGRTRAALLQGKLPTKKGVAAASAASSKFNKEQLQSNRDALSNIGSTLGHDEYGNELLRVARGEGSDVLRAKKGDVSVQKAAIAELAGRGDVKEIRSLPSSGVDNQLIMQGIEPHVGDVIAAAPDIVKGPAAYESISAEKMLNLDESSLELMIQQSKSNPTTRAALEGGAKTIHSSPELRAKLSGQAIEKLTNEKIIGPTGSPLQF